jgi:hypothetical protein
MVGEVITESTKTAAMLAILVAGGMSLANVTLACIRLPQMATGIYCIVRISWMEHHPLLLGIGIYPGHVSRR